MGVKRDLKRTPLLFAELTYRVLSDLSLGHDPDNILPTNPDEHVAVADNVDAIRVLGSTYYSHLDPLPYNPKFKSGWPVETFVEATLFMTTIFFKEHAPRYLPQAQRQLRYLLEGVEMSAKRSGNKRTIQYASSKLRELFVH